MSGVLIKIEHKRVVIYNKFAEKGEATQSVWICRIKEEVYIDVKYVSKYISFSFFPL